MHSLFSIPKNLIYLNSGTMAWTPQSVLQFVENEKKEFEENPSMGLFSVWSKLDEVQTALANYFKARPQDLFLRTNVTYAMNDFLMALQLPTNSEILVSDVEYGAVWNICRYKAQQEGHQLKVMSIPARGPELEKLSEDTIVEIFQKNLSPKTKLVMLSHVTTGASLCFPIEKIAQICRSKKIFFAVDGAHGAGSMPLDFSQTQVDFYGSNLHKWLMGPKGTGFGWVSPSVREYLKPHFAGWTTFNEAEPFQNFANGDVWAQRWMICSTHNFSDFLGVKETLKFWQSLGEKSIFNKQSQIRDFTFEQITRTTGWKCLRAEDKKLQGPMLAFDLPDVLVKRGFELVFSLLEKNHLQVSMTYIQNRWCMRLAPHIYNTEEEIEKAANILGNL